MVINTRNKSIYEKTLKLRRIGHSYNEISNKLNIAKSTVSNWLSDKNWSNLIKSKLIKNNRQKNINNLIIINKLKHFKTIKRHEEYRNKARFEYDKLKYNRLFLTGLAIYWGEGEKADSGRVSLVNSDARMLKVVINFYRKILKIPEEKLRAALFIYNDINENKAMDYWSKTLNIGKNNFIKTQILPSRSRLTRNKVVYGMCNIYFSDTEINIKIKEWINMMGDDMRD